MNVSVSAVYEDGALISWSHKTSPYIRGLEITILTVAANTSTGPFIRYFFQIDMSRTTYRARGLQRGRSYECVMREYGVRDVYSQPSPVVHWTNKQGDGGFYPPQHYDTLGSVILMFLLAGWIWTLVMFGQKWNELCFTSTNISYSKPKNFDRIKIVKKPTDSVIHRSRRAVKRAAPALQPPPLPRMHTLPAIKLDISGFPDSVATHGKRDPLQDKIRAIFQERELAEIAGKRNAFSER